MTTHYEVLRPITPADLHTCSTYVEILKSLPLHGYVTFEMFRHIDKTGSTRCMAYACSRGILKRISPHERILKLDSVKFWVTQLNKSGHKNSVSKHGTRPLYLQGLSRFDEWLPGRSFQSHETVVAGGQITKKAVTKSFANVEELLHYCIESGYGTKAAQRAIREYLVSPQVDKMSDSLYMSTRSAIKSYFSINDQALDLPRTRKKRADLTTDNKPSMSLEDFYKMLQNGKPGIMMRTIMLVKFHSGMDSSTLTDRFNYEGYSQIVRYFKTDDHAMWNLDLCPVPIRLVRVKTGVQYTTFLEHDAIAQLQEYLTWKEMKYDKQDPSKPLFMTKQKTPIRCVRIILWLSRSFSLKVCRCRPRVTSVTVIAQYDTRSDASLCRVVVPFHPVNLKECKQVVFLSSEPLEHLLAMLVCLSFESVQKGKNAPVQLFLCRKCLFSSRHGIDV